MRQLARAGARVVGVSTIDGLLADPGGLDVDELLALRERHGDRLVEHGPGRALPREALFELDCDVLVPGARPDAITREALLLCYSEGYSTAEAAEFLSARGRSRKADCWTNEFLTDRYLYSTLPLQRAGRMSPWRWVA